MPDPTAPAALPASIEELLRIEQEHAAIDRQLRFNPGFTGPTAVDEIRRMQDELIEYQGAIEAAFGLVTAAPRKSLVELAANLEDHHQEHHRREQELESALAAERSKRVELEAELADTKEELLVAGQSEGEALGRVRDIESKLKQSESRADAAERERDEALREAEWRRQSDVSRHAPDEISRCRIEKGDATWHDGPGWYYFDSEYSDEGSIGAFETLEECVLHACNGGQYFVESIDGKTYEEPPDSEPGSDPDSSPLPEPATCPRCKGAGVLTRDDASVLERACPKCRGSGTSIPDPAREKGTGDG